jgi:hypothetical protein
LPDYCRQLVDLGGSRLVQLLTERVVGILGPGEPDLSDPQLAVFALLVAGAEQAVQSGERGNMVVVLMGDHQDVNPAAGICCNVGDDLGQTVINVLRTQNDAAIDQHMPETVVLLWQCDQETVAQSLSVHPDRGPCYRGRGGRPALRSIGRGFRLGCRSSALWHAPSSL